MKLFALVMSLMCFSFTSLAAPSIEIEKAESQKFLEKEAKVAKTEAALSGMLYRPIKIGKGDYPGSNDTVTVEYKGSLRTGKIFDASPKGKPVSFSLNGVIPCWTEALKKMQVGGTAVIFCPSHIAYGDQGAGDSIPGGAALKFEVTLLKTAPF